MKKTETIFEKVKTYIDKHRLVSSGDRVLLSLSAGKDSMAMLDIFLRLREERMLELGIFHLNHQMRGEESEADEVFVKETAARLSISIYSEQYNFKKNKERGVSFEESARNKRYELLENISLKHKFNRIATGHSQDDNIETILMRIFSGTGINGLVGIKPHRDTIIRPLRVLSSVEVYNYLKEYSLEWREDSSNLNREYQRNCIRHDILPIIQKQFPGVNSALESLSVIAGEYIDVMDELLSKGWGDYFTSSEKQVSIEIEPFISDERLFRLVIAHAIRQFNHGYVRRGMLQEIYRKTTVERSNLIVYSGHGLTIQKIHEEGRILLVIRKFSEQEEKPVPDWEYQFRIPKKKEPILIQEVGIPISLETVSYASFLSGYKKKDKIFIEVPPGISHITIRNRRGGDRIKLEGGTKKVKDLMIEYKLDLKSKKNVPLLLLDNRVAAFMPGLVMNIPSRTSSDFFVSPNSKKILAIYCEEI